MEAGGGQSVEHFDWVLMDVHLPLLDGCAATRLIRSDPRSAEAKVVAMSASAESTDRTRCWAAGMDGYLSTPVGARTSWRRSCAGSRRIGLQSGARTVHRGPWVSPHSGLRRVPVGLCPGSSSIPSRPCRGSRETRPCTTACWDGLPVRTAQTASESGGPCRWDGGRGHPYRARLWSPRRRHRCRAPVSSAQAVKRLCAKPQRHPRGPCWSSSRTAN